MDSKVRQQILNKLTKYGDRVMGDLGAQDSTSNSSGSVAPDERPKRRKMSGKKRKKIRGALASPPLKSSGIPEGGVEDASPAAPREKQSSMKEFEEELRAFMASSREPGKEGKEGGEMDRRIGAGRAKGKRRAPEVIVFNDPTKRKQERAVESSRGIKQGMMGLPQHEEEVELELEAARHDVWKFAVSGLTYEDREKREAAKAVQLGAKPPRREYVNYKELMESRKQKREADRQEREMNRLMGMKTAKSKADKVQLKNKGFWTDTTQRKGVYIDGQLGKYKRGVQVITRRDVARVKNGRGGKR